MGARRDAAARANTWEERAIADSCRAKNNVLTIGEVICRIDAVEILFVTISDQFLSLLVIARPHFALHVATETFDSRGREYRFWRTANAHVKIHGRVGQRRRNGRRNISIANHPQRRACRAKDRKSTRLNSSHVSESRMP